MERYRQSTRREVSDPDYWMSLHHHSQDDEADHDYEVEVEGEPPEFYRGRAVCSGLNNELEGEPHGPPPALPPEVDEHGPLGPLDRVPRNPHNPVTYLPLTWDEIDGTRYPDKGVDLSQCSDYKRVTRIICVNAMKQGW